MAYEDEFAKRDEQGLQPRKSDDESAAAKALANYKKLILGTVIPLQFVLSIGVYLVAAYAVGMKSKLDAKFAVLSEYDLGYVYLAVYMVILGRTAIMVNANVARAGARVDRPDQHCYRVMDPKAPKDAAYVLMATTGWQGRFNRAQRGAFNTDEALPQFLLSTCLAGIFNEFDSFKLH